MHTPRTLRLPRSPMMLALALPFLVGACGVLLGLEDRRLDESASGSSGPGGACDTPADCPVAGNACFVRVCVSNVCGLIDAPEGTLVASQKKGDCRRVECDLGGTPVEVEDPTDVFDDGRICTQDLCDGKKPTHRPAAQLTPCGDGRVCNDTGSCVECLEDADCGGGELVCDQQACVPDSCENGIEENDKGETDVDCGGGGCNPCFEGDKCESGPDCESGVCSTQICQASSCNDNKKNGSESDVDCGGFAAACPRCSPGDGCGANDDCASGVCGGGVPKTCQWPSCTDAVMNGDELAPDCAGSSCLAGSCDDGEPCGVDLHCQSGVCDGGFCLAPTCSDGVKNGTEEGLDCGGTCPPC